MWEKFQINNINSELSKKLSQYESKYLHNLDELFNEKVDPLVKKRKFEWDFGYILGNDENQKQ